MSLFLAGPEGRKDRLSVLLYFLIRRAALGDGRGVQVACAVGVHSAKRAAVQCRVQKADILQVTVNGMARFHPCFLERYVLQSAVVEMGVCDGRMEKRHILHGAAMKFGTGKGCPIKGGLFDPAYGKGAVAEPGKVKIRMIGYAVERHPVKIGFTEKARRKTVLCRPVVKPLVNDLQRAFLAGVKYLVVVLLAAALVIRPGQKLFLRLKIHDTLPEHRSVSVIVRPAAAYRVHPGEQFVNRMFTPAL